MEDLPMKISAKTLSILILLLFSFGINNCTTEPNPAVDIHLPSIFDNNMVMQQKTKVPVWGEAEPGGKVVIQIAGLEASAIVSDDGNWRTSINSPEAGGPYELKIIGQKTITYKNVMFGEVWLASGQSNMQMPFADWGKINNYKQEIAEAKYPDIRLFQAKHVMSNTPLKEIQADGWKECSPETIAEFSATAYFFGRYLYKKLKVPIGIIHSSWGGTVVEAWTSGKTLADFPEFDKPIQYLTSPKSPDNDIFKVHRETLKLWQDKINKQIYQAKSVKQGWQNPDYNDKNWKTMNVPGTWESQGLDFDGIVWFRKAVKLPDSWLGQDINISLGPINDFDITWVNGEKIGSEALVSIPRNYIIPASLIKDGKMTIAVQILDIGNSGGMYGHKNQIYINNQSGDTLSLAGLWHFKTDPFQPKIEQMPVLPTIMEGPNRPTVLFNAMISPILTYAIKGAIWYQGESNAGRAYQYRKLFSSMIRDWRSYWKQGNFYFLFVQLANFQEHKTKPSDDAWAELREAQLMALKEPNTGMAVAIDIGDAKDIHPKNKQEVGRRLALNALKLAYDKNIENSGPIYKSMSIEGNKIRLSFEHADSGLMIKNGTKLKGFAIAGKDKKFKWAKAKIDGNSVVVWNSSIKQPVAVRYAWQSNPVCNLYNKAGLPASPFRTDQWKGITEGNK